MRSASGIDRLLAVMRSLRDPDGGCPWDLEQSFESIAPYTIEEAYEVADAIGRADWKDLKTELGDLLLQVAYHAQMAWECGLFDFDDVAHAIADKMIARHPHVFGDAPGETAVSMIDNWERQKSAERAAKAAANEGEPSLLDDIPQGFPALLRAFKLQKRAAKAGFDWPGSSGVRAKLDEEVAELDETLRTRAPSERIEEEISDLLFTTVNLARHLGIDAEQALRRGNAKFERRFRRMERLVLEGQRDLSDLSPDELEGLWVRAKAEE